MLKFRGFVSSGKKVVMCGQTIGPFFSWRKNIMKNLLKNVTKIIARDPVTYKYLTEEFKLKNVLLGSDLAFLPLAGEKDQHSQSQVNPEYYGLKEKYFTIVPSELIWRYAKEPSREVYIDILTNAALYLLENHREYQLLILPHVLAPDSSDDRLAGRDLYINLKRKGIENGRMIFLKEQLLPFQARKLLAQSQIVFTGRMHAAISSFACGVPALSLSYSRKYWGIIGEHFGLKELIVDVRDKRWETIEKYAKSK
jgi:colanic acid/amylovoran biosynthesis protein